MGFLLDIFWIILKRGSTVCIGAICKLTEEAPPTSLFHFIAKQNLSNYQLIHIRATATKIGFCVMDKFIIRTRNFSEFRFAKFSCSYDKFVHFECHGLMVTGKCFHWRGRKRVQAYCRLQWVCITVLGYTMFNNYCSLHV